MPHLTGKSNFLPFSMAVSRCLIASVYSMRSKSALTKLSSRLMQSLSIRCWKNSMSSCRSLRTAVNMCFSKPSARFALSFRSANAISGSTIQNSARCLVVLEFSARNVGPKV